MLAAYKQAYGQTADAAQAYTTAVVFTDGQIITPGVYVCGSYFQYRN